MFKPPFSSRRSLGGGGSRLLLVCGLWSLVCLLPSPASAQSRQPITLISGTTTAYVDTVILNGTGITSLTASNYLTGRRIATLTLTGGTTGTDSNTVNALIAAGTSLNASNWLGWASASNWLHTAFYPLGSNPSNFTSLVQVWSAGALSNNWTGGAIMLDGADSKTNTYGGSVVIGGNRFQANGGIASGSGAWANYNATASGNGSWANYGANASGSGAWANYNATASGDGSWANYGANASGDGAWAMGDNANASNANTFVWSDGTAVGSDTNKTFTVYATNGIRLLGGPITGNGSGLTNLNLVGSGGITNIAGGGTWNLSNGAYTFTPTGITAEAQSALDGKLGTNGVAQSSVVASNALQLGGVAAANYLTNGATGAVTFNGNVTLNGTGNTAPNQTASSGASVLTRDLGDGRYLTNYTTAAVQFNGTSLVLNNQPFSPSVNGIFYGTNVVGTTEQSGGYRIGIGGNSLNAFFTMSGSLGTSTIFGGIVAGDGYRRFRISADGSMYWGDGTFASENLLKYSSRSNMTAYGTWTFDAVVAGVYSGNGSGITNVNAATLGGVALGGLVQTNRQIIAGANITVNGGASAPLTGDVTIASTASGGGVIPISLLPGSALTFGSTNNATIIGTSNGDVGATSNNWDELEFDWLTAQSAPWQLMNHNATGMTNVEIWIRSPATGNLTNVFSFGYIAGTNGGLRPPTWTASIVWTQAVATVTNELQKLTGTITCPAVGPVWFNLRRDATSAADTLATNSYFVGGRLW